MVAVYYLELNTAILSAFSEIVFLKSMSREEVTMPMDRSLYPKDWDTIAREVKEAAGWKCQECDRPCRMPGESFAAFQVRHAAHFLVDEKPGQHVLTVAHLDHVPANCDRSNLRALCTVCHCRYDLGQMPLKKYLKRERLGQFNLFDLTNPSPAGHGRDTTRVQQPIRLEVSTDG